MIVTKRLRPGRDTIYVLSMGEVEYDLIMSVLDVTVTETIDAAPDDLAPGMPEWADMLRLLSIAFKENR